jgi:hypothetical protein
MSRTNHGVNVKNGDDRKTHFPTEIAGYRGTDCVREKMRTGYVMLQ